MVTQKLSNLSKLLLSDSRSTKLKLKKKDLSEGT